MVDSLRLFSVAAVKLCKTHVELALVEIQQEMERMHRGIALAVIAGFFLLLGMLVLTALAVRLLEPAIGLTGGLALFAVLYLGVAGAVYAVKRSQKKKRPEFFATTLREFEKDCDSFCALLQKEEIPQPDETEDKSRISTSFL